MRWDARTRRTVLGASLALSLLATGWVMSGDDAGTDLTPVTKAPRRDARGPVAAGGTEPLQLDRLRREAPGVSETVSDVFAGKTWYVPPPPPPPTPPPKPVAPALPFTYFGQMVEAGQITVVVARQDRTYAVKAGDTIDGTYRVEDISPPVMTWMYLPLNEKQTLPIGGAR